MVEAEVWKREFASSSSKKSATASRRHWFYIFVVFICFIPTEATPPAQLESSISQVTGPFSNTTCFRRRCNEEDLHCQETGMCDHGYRTCCDGSCTLKKTACDNGVFRTGYSVYASNANASEYTRLLEITKQKIKSYIANQTCWPEEYCANATTCKPTYTKCNDGKQCALLLSRCSMFWLRTTFERVNNVSCYPAERCFRNNCRGSYWMCDDGECVDKSVLCRGGPDCDDGSDEKYCQGSCFPPDRCQNGSCSSGYFRCENGECIFQEQVCDATKDCMDGSDEYNCTAQCWPSKACLPDGKCKPGYFGCDSGKCIEESNVCDTRTNCDDGSDEIRNEHGFKCILGNNFDTCVLPQEQMHEPITRCIDHSDECIRNGTDYCFHCLDGQLTIAERQRCDGVVDCFDASDECLCDHETAGNTCLSICLHINSNYSASRFNDAAPQGIDSRIPRSCACAPGRYDCGNGVCLNVSQLCDGVPDCGDDAQDEIYCERLERKSTKTILCPGDVKNTNAVTAVACDGRVECYNLEDECDQDCNVTAPFCKIKSRFNSANGPYEFLCDQVALFFNAKAICDGRWTPCMPRVDEEELDCPARHYCRSGEALSIDINLICDGTPQCDDFSDEANCSDRFYCESGSPYSVPASSKRDGKADCSDESDECPREMDNAVLSSRKELVGSLGFRIVTWVFALLALTGNAVTLAGACKTLFFSHNTNRVSRVNYFFLLNLSLADGLMGIYLVLLSTYGLRVSGDYCRHDKAWRTSAMCLNLGSLALVSSEVSVIILAYLSTFRLLSITFPVKIKNSSLRLPVAGVSAAWTIGTFLAVIPRLPSLSDYFVSEAWIPNKYTQFDELDKIDIIVLMERLAILHPVKTLPPKRLSWQDMTQYLGNMFDVQVKGYFGYFSDNSVCLPRFYAAKGEAGWEYSTGVITFNFTAFCYVCAVYWAVFRLTSQSAGKLNAKQLRKLHGRISFLIVTDFICWVPVCLMSFIRLGGVRLPDSAYALSAVVLLPVNSALNPFIYSHITLRSLFAAKVSPTALHKRIDDASQKPDHRKASRTTAMSLDIFPNRSAGSERVGQEVAGDSRRFQQM